MTKKGALSPGLLKYQAEQRAKKEALSKVAEESLMEVESEAKIEAQKAAEQAVQAGAIKCVRCGLVFEKSAAREVANFGGRLGCPECGFPIPQK